MARRGGEDLSNIKNIFLRCFSGLFRIYRLLPVDLQNGKLFAFHLEKMMNTTNWMNFIVFVPFPSQKRKKKKCKNLFRILAPNTNFKIIHIQVQHFAIIVAHFCTVYIIKGLNVQVNYFQLIFIYLLLFFFYICFFSFDINTNTREMNDAFSPINFTCWEEKKKTTHKTKYKDKFK